MAKAKSPSQENYKDYIKGKARLQHAILLQPDDKINDYIKKSTNRRFWIKDYHSFKESMMQESPAIGLSPGEGNPIAPTPSSLGSGDKFPDLSSNSKKKKKKVNESFGDSQENFEYPLTNRDILIFNEPAEFGSIHTVNAKIQYSAEIDYNRFGIENINFTINNILLHFESEMFAPNDLNQEEAMDEEHEFNVAEPHVELIKLALPFYPSEMNINMRNSSDPKTWTFDIQFGRDTY